MLLRCQVRGLQHRLFGPGFGPACGLHRQDNTTLFHTRRIILSAWNPSHLGKMYLPPCHVMAQFFVSGQGLSCMVFQRSVDVGLGLPFHIASYSLPTHMNANCCGLRARESIHSTGDTHIYRDHVGPLERQLSRSPLEFPTMELIEDMHGIGNFSSGDIKLTGHLRYPVVKNFLFGVSFCMYA